MVSTLMLNNPPTLGDEAVFFGNVSACVFCCAAGQTAVRPLRAACGTAAVIRDAAAGVCVERDPGEPQWIPLHNQGYHLEQEKKVNHPKHHSGGWVSSTVTGSPRPFCSGNPQPGGRKNLGNWCRPPPAVGHLQGKNNKTLKTVSLIPAVVALFSYVVASVWEC